MRNFKNLALFNINKLKPFLSNRITTQVIIITVIAARVLQLLFFFNTRNDMSYQILAAQNFYHGHGMNLTEILPENLSSLKYVPLIQWPPGFSILFAPFYAISDENYIAAALIISIVFGIALILICRSILKVLNIPLYLINIYTLLTGFSIYYFYHKPCTDAVAISFFAIGFYLSLLLLNNQRSSILKTSGIIFCLGMCGYIKYLYIPVVLVIPLFIFLKGLLEKKLIITKAGLISFLILGLAFAILLGYQNQISGSIAYIKEPERGFFPENLLFAFPFLISSFIKPESLNILFNFQGNTSSLLLHIFQFIHLISFILLSIFFVKKLKKSRLNPISTYDNFFYLGFLVSIAITCLLSYLSIKVAKEFVDNGVFWTYVEEPRYYGVITILLQLSVFVIYQCSFSKSVRVKVILYTLFILMGIEMFRGMIFTSHRIYYLNQEEYGWQQEQKFQIFTKKMLATLKKEYSADKIIITGSNNWLNVRAALYNELPIFENVDQINNIAALNTQDSVLIFAILSNAELTSFKSFLDLTETRYLGKDGNFSFYSYYLKPHYR